MQNQHLINKENEKKQLLDQIRDARLKLEKVSQEIADIYDSEAYKLSGLDDE